MKDSGTKDRSDTEPSKPRYEMLGAWVVVTVLLAFLVVAGVRRDGVSIDGLLSKVKTSGARVRLVVIEASRRNPYERRFRAYSHGLAAIQPGENTLILSSAAPGQVVDDSDEPHSRLMTALLAQMNSSKGIEEVFENARNAVAAATQGHQIPSVSSTLTETGDLWPPRSGAPGSSVGSAASGRRG